MNKIYITQNDIYRMVEETNNFKPNQKVVGWHYSGDEIVFSTNRKNHETEHYYLDEFVAQVDANFKEADDAKCNQFGTEFKEGKQLFYFYRDEGATDCHIRLS